MTNLKKEIATMEAIKAKLQEAYNETLNLEGPITRYVWQSKINELMKRSEDEIVKLQDLRNERT